MKRLRTVAFSLAAVGGLLGVSRAAAPNDDPGEKAAVQRPADNSGKNVRDRTGTLPTAGQQSNAKGDRALTQAIRKQVIGDRSLSTNAHNVKIITQHGIVTLRGPVKSQDEKDNIAAKARSVRGVKRVDNQLEIAG